MIGNGDVISATPGEPRYTDAPPGRVTELAKLDTLDGWTADVGRNYVLEYYDFMCPRRKGDFRFEAVKSFEGDAPAIRVTPQPLKTGKPTMPMYTVLRSAGGIAMPGRPTEIGLWVNGNSGWGRVIFELVDASGQTWTSIGAPQAAELSPWLLDWMPKEALANGKKPSQNDWNTDDSFGLSRFDFDGWRYVGFPLPGHYPGEGFPWRAASQWRYDGDGKVHYPLTLKAITIELQEKVLHLTDYAPVPRPEIYIKRLIVAQDDSPTIKTTVAEWGGL